MRKSSLSPFLWLLLLACSGCVRALINAQAWQPRPFEGEEPLTPWTRDAYFFRAEPSIKPLAAVLFVHGFAGIPEFHSLSLRRLAAEGFLVWAPELPDLNLLFPFGYHESLRTSALAAYDQLAKEAASQGLGKPFVMGYSQGGGAALFVAQERHTAAVLWSPTPLAGPLPRPNQPVLVVAGSEDCIADRGPIRMARALGPSAKLWILEGANHLAFTDPLVADFIDCPAKISHHSQRMQAIRVSADFFKALLAKRP